MRRALLLLAAAAAGCVGISTPVDAGSGAGGGIAGGSAGGLAGGAGGGSAGGSAGGVAGGTGGGSAGGSAGGLAGGAGGGAGGGSTCLAGAFLASLGRSSVLSGGSFNDAEADAGWDVRYQYLSGSLADGAGPCASCQSCTTAGTTCANSGPGCAWWGCWQYEVPPPGDFARGFVRNAKGRAQLPMFTYYILLQASGLSEGTAEVAALDDQAFLTRYFNDFRFLLQQIGNDVAILHLEPDFWGYAQRLNADPHLIPARVAAANPTDCSTLEGSAAGFGRCLVAMVRRYAPNAKVGLHASSWATSVDVLCNTNAALDLAGEAGKVADFLKECGGASADFVVVDASDRDSGYYEVVRGQNRWWDATNATLPNLVQAFAWSKALAERLGRPVLWWQLPVGNMNGTNVPNHYRDNRVDSFFSHTLELARSHGAGFFFGPGAGDQTSAATDDGNLLTRINAYRASSGQAACP